MARPDKRRRQIAAEAARRLTRGGDMRRARITAGRRLTRGWVPEEELPSAAEVGREVARQRLTGEPDRSGGLAALIGDRFDRLAALVRPLAAIRLTARAASGFTMLDVALQAFAFVEQEFPYDEELLTAALLVEAGQSIDRRDPAGAILTAASGLLTERTMWLIASHSVAVSYRDRTLGFRARQRLEQHPDFEAVLVLANATGHPLGGTVHSFSLDEAVGLLRRLEAYTRSDMGDEL